MKTKTILFIMALLPIFAFAQYDKMLETMDDEMETLENGKLVLRFINAENGNPVEAATVNIEGIGKYISDMQGKVFIDTVSDKTYSFHFIKDGFIPATYNFEVITGTIFFNRFSVSPVIDFGALRVVLDWGKSPADLDIHLVREGGYHISYQNMHLANDGTAKLDRDDLKGFGPETITVKAIDNNATYSCYVKNFSDKDSPNSRALSKSRANIKVYGNNQLLKTYTIKPDQKGTTWMVFGIVNGKITDKDEVGNAY
ncbi:MAG: hypothetical protein WCM93_11180 [Bacteroidota bacterium]